MATTTRAKKERALKSEGADFITIFWEFPKDRFFAQLTDRMARGC